MDKKKKINFLVKAYDKHYKALMIIPLILLLLSIGIIANHYIQTGDIINRGVSLKGGVQITVFTEKQIDVTALENVLSLEFSDRDITARSLQSAGKQIGFTVASDVEAKDQKELQPLINSIASAIKEDLTKDDYNIELIGSSLGKSFFQQTLIALIMAFMFMGAVVFYYFADNKKTKLIAFAVTIIDGILIFKYFMTNIPMTIIALIVMVGLLLFYLKESTPSFAVILAIVADIIITLAVVTVLDIKLSTAGIAAFLMLIGYSVDTDILLSTRVLKRDVGSVLDRTLGAMKTGMLMTATTLAAVIISLIITQSDTLRQIMIIILIGLIVDVINTWIQNAGLLRWYVERKEKS